MTDITWIAVSVAFLVISIRMILLLLNQDSYYTGRQKMFELLKKTAVNRKLQLDAIDVLSNRIIAADTAKGVLVVILGYKRRNTVHFVCLKPGMRSRVVRKIMPHANRGKLLDKAVSEISIHVDENNQNVLCFPLYKHSLDGMKGLDAAEELALKWVNIIKIQA